MHTLFSLPQLEANTSVPQKRVSARNELSRPKIISAVNLMRCATAEQLIRLLRYSPNTLVDMQVLLKTLAQEQVVEIEIPNKQTSYGRAPNVYLIGRRARSFLAERGEPVSQRYRRREDRLHKGDPINHTLAVGDVLIHAKHLEYSVSDIWIDEYFHEWELNAKKLRVPVLDEGQEKIEKFAPDSIFVFDDGGRNRLQLFEIYRTPIDEKRWKRKVRAYVYAWPIFKERFGIRDLQIAVINGRASDFPKLVTEKRHETQELLEAREQVRRHRNMLRWTAEEMEQLGYADHADIFYFSTIRHNRVGFHEFWFAPHWTIPINGKHKALFYGREGR